MHFLLPMRGAGGGQAQAWTAPLTRVPLGLAQVSPSFSKQRLSQQLVLAPCLVCLLPYSAAEELVSHCILRMWWSAAAATDENSDKVHERPTGEESAQVAAQSDIESTSE